MTAESGDFDDDHDGPGGSEDPPHRAWLPPDDRLWRHPSELRGTGSPLAGVPGLHARGRRLPGARVLVKVALGGAVGALVAAGIVTSENWFGPATTSDHGGSTPQGGAQVTTASAVVAPPGTRAVQNHASVNAAPSLMDLVAKVWPSIVTVDVATGHGHLRGSGLVFRNDGMVVTVARLLAGAAGISVITSAGRQEGATVLGTDDDDGLAVLRVDSQMPSLDLTSSPAPTPGQVAIVVSPSGDVGSSPTSTICTIKAVNRQVRVDGRPPLLDAIETDAPAGPAPGGVLVDQSGSVVGMTTDTSDGGGAAHWVAAPTALVHDAVDQLVSKGKVVRAWLGISAADHQDGGGSGGNNPPGVEVLTVQSNSPAASAGILPRDIIDAVDGQPVPSLLDLQGALRLHRPGVPVVLDVIRNGGHWPMHATLGSEAA